MPRSPSETACRELISYTLQDRSQYKPNRGTCLSHFFAISGQGWIKCSHHREHSRYLGRKFNRGHCFNHDFFSVYESCLVTITSWATMIDCSCNVSISNHRLQYHLMYYRFTCSVPRETAPSCREIFEGTFIFSVNFSRICKSGFV